MTYTPDFGPDSVKALSLDIQKTNDQYTLNVQLDIPTHLDTLIKGNFQIYIGCTECTRSRWYLNKFTCDLPDLRVKIQNEKNSMRTKSIQLASKSTKLVWTITNVKRKEIWKLISTSLTIKI